jgi:hypothetical protein
MRIRAEDPNRALKRHKLGALWPLMLTLPPVQINTTEGTTDT